MPNATEMDIGSVGSLWRYPIKSMMGEELNAIGSLLQIFVETIEGA